MKAEEIIDAWVRIRKVDSWIPDEVLDFMRDAALERISQKGRYRDLQNFFISANSAQEARDFDFNEFTKLYIRRNKL